MLGWHHRLHASEFEQAPRDGEGQGSLVCCCPWDRSQTLLSDWTTTFVYTLFWPCSVACGILVPQSGMEQWKHWVLTTGPTGNSHLFILFIYCLFSICGIYSDMILPIHLCQLCLLSFFLISLARGLSVLLIFTSSIWFHWLFVSFFGFSLMSAPIFIICFLSLCWV